MANRVSEKKKSEKHLSRIQPFPTQALSTLILRNPGGSWLVIEDYATPFKRSG